MRAVHPQDPKESSHDLTRAWRVSDLTPAEIHQGIKTMKQQVTCLCEIFRTFLIVNRDMGLFHCTAKHAGKLKIISASSWQPQRTQGEWLMPIPLP